MLILLLSCSRPVEVKEKPEEFFLKKYKEGIYRFKVENVKSEGKNLCSVEIKDLIKGKEYKLRVFKRFYVEPYIPEEKIYCEIFSKRRYLEVAGDKFVPPSDFKIVQNIQLEDKLYLWIYESVKRYGGGGGIFFIPWGVGGFDYRYGYPGRYGGK